MATRQEIVDIVTDILSNHDIDESEVVNDLVDSLESSYGGYEEDEEEDSD